MCFVADEDDVKIATLAGSQRDCHNAKSSDARAHQALVSCYTRERADDLTSRRTVRETQYACYDLSGLVEQASGLPLVDLDWCDILQKVYASLTFETSRSCWNSCRHEWQSEGEKSRGSVLLDMVETKKRRQT